MIYTILYYVLVPIFVQSICIIFFALTKILRALVATMQLVPATAYRLPSISNGGAPIPVPANVGPYIPPPSHQYPIRSTRPIHLVAIQFPHTIHLIKIQFLQENPIKPILIQSSRYNPSSPLKWTPQQASRNVACE